MEENYCTTCSYLRIESTRGQEKHICAHPEFVIMDYIKNSPQHPVAFAVRHADPYCKFWLAREAKIRIPKSPLDYQLVFNDK